MRKDFIVVIIVAAAGTATDAKVITVTDVGSDR